MEETMNDILVGVLIVVSTLAIAYDWKIRKIPDWLTKGGLLIALILRGIMGLDPFLLGLAGAALGFFLGFALFAAKIMGGGDGKLLMTMGAILGIKLFLSALLFIGLVGGVMAFVVMLFKKQLGGFVSRVGTYFLQWKSQGGKKPEWSPISAKSGSIPYGLAISIGSLLAWFI